MGSIVVAIGALIGLLVAWNYLRKQPEISGAIMGTETDLNAARRAGWNLFIAAYERVFVPIFVGIGGFQLASFIALTGGVIYVESEKLHLSDIAWLVSAALFSTMVLGWALVGRTVALVADSTRRPRTPSDPATKPTVGTEETVLTGGTMRLRLPTDPVTMPTVAMVDMVDDGASRRMRLPTDPATMPTVGTAEMVLEGATRRPRQLTDPPNMPGSQTVELVEELSILRPRTSSDPATLLTQATVRRVALSQLIPALLATAAVTAIVTFGVGLTLDWSEVITLADGSKFTVNGKDVEVLHRGSRLIKGIGLFYVLYFLVTLAQFARMLGFIAKSGIASFEYTLKQMAVLMAVYFKDSAEGLKKLFTERPNAADEDKIDPAIRSMLKMVIAPVLTVGGFMLAFEDPRIPGLLTVISVINWGVTWSLMYLHSEYGYAKPLVWAERSRLGSMIIHMILAAFAIIWFLFDAILGSKSPVQYWRIQQASAKLADKGVTAAADGLVNVADGNLPPVQGPTGVGQWLLDTFLIESGWIAAAVMLVAGFIAILLIGAMLEITEDGKHPVLKWVLSLAGLAFLFAAFIGAGSMVWDIAHSSGPSAPKVVVVKQVPVSPRHTGGSPSVSTGVGDGSPRNPYLDAQCARLGGCAPAKLVGCSSSALFFLLNTPSCSYQLGGVFLFYLCLPSPWLGKVN